MATEVVMPKLGLSMKEGTVSVWIKKVGDFVSKGEIIANINSEKIEMEYESPAEGTLLEIIVPEGQGVPPGTVICYLGNPNEKVGGNTKTSPNLIAQEEVAAAVAEVEPVTSSNIQSNRREIKISPIARKMAEAAGLNIELIRGTGPQGRITKEDVEQAIAGQSSSESPSKLEEEMKQRVNQDVEQVKRIPVSGIRKVIASRMHDSLRHSAQLTLTMKADVTDLVVLQKQMSEVTQKQYEVKLTLTDFVARAVVLSLQKHKSMNSAYVEDQIHEFGHVHLGMAVALDKGLVVPVIRHAQNCSLIDLSKNIKSLAGQARQGQLGSEEMQGSTFTITNLGAYGVEHFTPVLNLPETGILGVGAVQDTPVYKGEELQKRSILPLSLTFDHRVLDGAPAAEFLLTIKQHLEEPFRMLL
ncbi:dihydrolipoamide acetyltransferase family protein [Ammoniphilus sp. 3BR4]|uniref:dihydrolipoamide acetyltransferase family protein n=1 Tax=Ammoniphilus sp. 3BR4 TaxID=3158265 RepID=UPI0034679D96